MNTIEEANDINTILSNLKSKNKEPHSIGVLNSWISRVENELDSFYQNRVSWLIATTIVTAKLQQVLNESKESRFLLKGGTLLQHKLGLEARSTRDLDGLVRGDIDTFFAATNELMREPWGSITFMLGEVELIETPNKITKPRRFEISLLLHGQVWRKIKVEISSDEGLAGTAPEEFPAPSLAGFGLPTPDHLIGLAMSYQIAQKIHAVTSPHNPPEQINERARDVVDLLLLRQLAEATGKPTTTEISVAIKDTFNVRAQEAATLGRPIHTWPAKISHYPHWKTDYTTAAQSAGVSTPINEAITQVNAWLEEIAKYPHHKRERNAAI